MFKMIDGVVSEMTPEEIAALAPSLEQVKAAKRQAAEAVCDAVFMAGYTVPSGAMQGEVLQTRNLTDRTNWLTSSSAYSVAVGAGAGAVLGAKFRTTSNQTFDLSYADGLAVLMAMAEWGAQVYANLWALKDAIDAAQTIQAVDAIDVEAGWP